MGPDQKISGLEDEYLLSRGNPSLFYVKAPRPDREAGLDALLDRIEDDTTASYVRFSYPDELGQRISDDLALLLTERFIISRGDEARPRAGGGLPLRRGPDFWPRVGDRRGETPARE